MEYTIAQVEAIKQDGKDVGDRCSKLFEDWLKTPHGCTPKTWGTLIKRIKDVDELYAAADQIQKEILGGKLYNQVLRIIKIMVKSDIKTGRIYVLGN